jgi:hypothetical protein
MALGADRLDQVLAIALRQRRTGDLRRPLSLGGEREQRKNRGGHHSNGR